ncbi:MAG: hypothetical protein IJ512_08065 [Ruminococcus sp.]|nr:hypothetical protein [Ruminococcus sp.]
MKKKKAGSALGVIVAIILIIVAATTMLTTILFANQDTPKLFGHYIYLQKSSAMEVTDSADDSASIHANTVVFAKEYNGTDPLSVNNAILCVLAPDDSSPIEDKDSNGYAIRRILRIEPNDETGELLYYPTTMQTDAIGTEPAITSSSILGLCEFEHAGLYSYITFVQTLPGIILLLALPCVLLIALLITKIVRSKNRKLDEEAYAFEESYDEVPGEDIYDEGYADDDDADYSDESYTDEHTSPLYTPDASSTSTLDRKRISIAQNFTQKAVNPNSPYQKARTMQFKAQKDIPILGGVHDQPQNMPAANEGSYVGKYSSDAPVSTPAAEAAPVQTSAPVQEYHGSHEAGGTGGRVFRSGASITSNFRKPNVDDILSGDPLARVPSAPAASAPVREAKPEKPAAKIAASSAKRSNKTDSSVDDLLAMIENQKKKL